MAANLPLPITITSGALLPVAFFLGIPFPIGPQRVANEGSMQVALAWAVNGVMSVAGAIGGVVIAHLWGFNVLLVGAALIYLGVLVLAIVIPIQPIKTAA